MADVRPLRLLFPVALGLTVGLGTAVLQQHLGHPWHALANSASPWLTGMFAAGTAFRGPFAAALGGLVAALFELAGYYTTELAFGWHFLRGPWVLLWLCAGLFSGPLFGWAGWRWFQSRPLSGLTSALLPAAWFTEALVYSRFGAAAPAAIFALVGICATLVLGLRHRQFLGIALGTIVVLPAGMLGEFALAFVYRRLP